MVKFYLLGSAGIDCKELNWIKFHTGMHSTGKMYKQVKCTKHTLHNANQDIVDAGQGLIFNYITNINRNPGVNVVALVNRF